MAYLCRDPTLCGVSNNRCEINMDVIANLYMRALAGEEVSDVINRRHQSRCGHVIRFQGARIIQ